VAPEAMAGGPLGVVQEGDYISLDCAGGKLNLEISDEDLKARLAARAAKPSDRPTSGYAQLYVDHVLQADEGCDFDFLVGTRGAAVPKHSH